MNICIFSANYLPNIGGIERYTYHMAKELIELGYSVTVVTSNLFDLADHEFDNGIEIYRLPCISLLNGRYPIYKKNEQFKRIDKELDAHNFDFIMVNARFYFHSLYAVKFAAKRNIPCITLEHGTTHLSVNNKVLDWLGGIYEHGFTHFIKKYCKEYYGVSRAACEWSGHFGIKSNGVLYNSIDPDVITEKIKAPVCSYRKELGIPDDAKVVAYTGRLIPEKGVVQLIDAVKKLNNKDVYLVFAGDGPLMNELKTLAEESKNIFLIGKIDFDHIVALLKETDIFCLPSVSEGFSTAVLEAVAAKCFIITTETGGTKELIAGDPYGIIMKGNSTEEVKTALERALSDNEYRARAIQNSYERLVENFTWKSTAAELDKIIKSKI